MNDRMVFVCASCGQDYTKWQGRCDSCNEWNTLKEFKFQTTGAKSKAQAVSAVSLGSIKTSSYNRIITQIGEFNRVLGGGIVPGSIMILGGDPGIGKSTLLLQLAASLKNVLYVSGEESLEQLKLRADRIKIKSQSLKLVTEINLDSILATLEKEKPDLAIIDSIQTAYSSNYPSTPGSIVQVRECALRLQQYAKTHKTAVILVGHVTKGGTVAGPRTLEHLVDAVLYLEGEHYHQQRILRGVKNRFGNTDEIGIFEMAESGLKEVTNPSKFFLSERLKNVPGVVVTAHVEGSRALLIEIQALTATSIFGYPQRRSAGFDLNRLQLLIAVLQKRADINLSGQDVFVNIVGGIKAREPGIDLAVAISIASALKNKPLDSKLCVFGEVGLSGEIRKIPFEQKRVLEAKRLGFNKFILEKEINQVIKKYV